jgi:hypothetical protein
MSERSEYANAKRFVFRNLESGARVVVVAEDLGEALDKLCETPPHRRPLLVYEREEAQASGGQP